MAEKVKRWRANWDKPDGVVLVWDAQPYGWKNELRNPEHERPGAVAIDVDGSWWVARGGNDLDGAERWVNIYEAKQEKVR
ncbi:MAG: antirestriction protein ArdR [Pseudohongiella sp.]|nr:antirestriction protein ArdR [Pseudohongiella sp.]